MRHLLILIACILSQVTAAEQAPYDNMNSLANLQTLGACSVELNEHGPSAATISRAMMAYVNLALDDDLRPQGDRGSLWRSAARRLQGELAALPDQQQADPRPAIWLDLLDGRCSQAIAAMEAAGLADTPHGRAMRIFATADFRIGEAIDTPLSAHEHYALGFAYLRNDLGDAIAALDDRDDLPGVGWAWLKAKAIGFTHHYQRQRLRETMRNVPLMLTTKAIDDATALAVGNPILAALDQPAADDRQSLVRELLAAVLAEDDWEGELLVAAWHACDPIRSGDAAIRDADGSWRLGNSALWARKVRQDIFAVAWDWHAFVRNSWGVRDYADRIATPLRDGDDGILRAISLLLSRTSDAPAAYDQAVTAELADPAGLPIAALCNPVRAFNNIPKPMKMELLSRLQTAAESRPTSAYSRVPLAILAQLHATLEMGYPNGELLAQAAAEDPWSVHWRLYGNGKPRSAAVAAALIEELPWRVDQHIVIANEARRKRRWQEAVDAYRQAIALNPGNADSRYELGRALLNLDQVDEAIAELEALEAESDDFVCIHARRYLGKAYERKNDLEAANRWYAKAARSVQSTAMCDYADFARRQKDWATARQWYQKDAERYKHTLSTIKGAFIDLMDPAVDDETARQALRDIDRAALNRTDNTWSAFWLYQEAGLQADWMLLLPDPTAAGNDLCFTALWSLVDLGRFDEALVAAESLSSGKRRNINARYRCWAQIYGHQMARLIGRSGLDEEAWQRLAEMRGISDSQANIIATLRGQRPRQDARNQALAIQDGEELLLWLALEDLACGRIDEATALLDDLVARHPTWREAHHARGIRRWMAAWDEATRQRFTAGVQQQTTITSGSAESTDLEF